MSRDQRKGYYHRDWDRDRIRERIRGRSHDRSDYRMRPPIRKRSRSPPSRREDSKRSRSPRKSDKDALDENILSEISKLPEPSELWDNQFQDGGFGAPPPPTFSQQAPDGMPNPGYSSNYQPSYSGIYDDFPSVGPPQVPHPPDIASWNQMSLPPPPTSQPQAPPAPFLNNVEDQIKKEAAIESEMRHQKAALSKQREDYVKKANILKKELDTLKDQRNELRGDVKRSPSPDTKRFLKENTKLQLEIQNKLKTIYNVVDMLNGIIGEEAPEIHDSDDSTERSTKRKSRSPSASKKFNYIYYDPEMHWCRVCNEFPPTAKDYLNHLHSVAHHKMAAAHLEAPWHSVSNANEGFPNYPSAPTKRTPIKGLQFFVPSTAWYCKLCDQFIGDLHCASAHLKSITHSKNYTNFVEQNPHWETDWMSDRQKAFEKSRSSKNKDGDKPQQYTAHTITFNKDGSHTKRKNSPSTSVEKKKKDKKKKSKRSKSSSSSSSSNSSTSDGGSNKKASKHKKQKRRLDLHDDKMLSEWVSNIQLHRLNDSDRKLLDTLKSRIKKDEDKRRSADRERTDARDRERIAELQRKLRESERRGSRSRSRSRSRESRSRKSRSRESRSRSQRDARASEPQPRAHDAKPPETKKMPFIGKMPVYKNLTKNSKTEEKKEDLKKKEEDEVTKKRREEMDAEIQKKVAEFKEKIARAQLEREQAQGDQHGAMGLLGPGGVGHAGVGPVPNPGPGLLPNPFLPPPTIVAPTTLAPAPARPQLAQAQSNQAQPQGPPQPSLPKDFQDALDIIFPSEVKNPDINQSDLFSMPPGFIPGLTGVMPTFPPLPMMNPQMFSFDMNNPLFQPRPQLYDSHVPLVPSPKPRQQFKRQQNQKNDAKKNNVMTKKKMETKKDSPKAMDTNNGDMRKMEEMDDLAMLGIDASDVGAGI